MLALALSHCCPCLRRRHLGERTLQAALHVLAAAVEGGGGIRKEGDDDGLSQEVWSRSLRDPMDFPRSSSRRLARAMMVELL